MICVQTISQRLYRTIFYLGGIFFAGLLVPADNDRLGSDKQNASSSPFVIAFDLAGVKIVSITFSVSPFRTLIVALRQLPHIVNAAILLSAWSAAASDVYISSRFLFFLARRGHAPRFLAGLIKYPWNPPDDTTDTSDSADDIDLDSDDEGPPRIETPRHTSLRFSIHEISLSEHPEDERQEEDSGKQTSHPIEPSHEDDKATEERVEIYSASESPHSDTFGEPDSMQQKEPYFVLPLYAVLTSASVGILSFLGSTNGNTAQVVSPLLYRRLW